MEKVLDAPGENWPVFPSFHRPTLSERITDVLTARRYTDAEIEDIGTERSQIEICTEFQCWATVDNDRCRATCSQAPL